MIHIFIVCSLIKRALSNFVSPDMCSSQSLPSCTLGGHECGYLGGLKDINGNYYSSPVCNTDLNGGGCVCENVAGYNYYTCLPDVNGCTMCYLTPQTIDLNNSPIQLPGYIAYNSGGYSMYYCFNQDYEYNTFTNEIRVIAAHAQATPTLIVNLRTCSGITDLSKPIKLLLTSYNKNDWIIKSDDQYVINNINVVDIQLWSYYDTVSTVTIDSSLSSVINVTSQIRYASSSTLGGGYGSDTGGGSSAKLLSNVLSELGDYAYSFVGQYATNAIEACVGNQGVIDTFDIFQENDTPTTTDTTAADTTVSPDVCSPQSLRSCVVGGHECGYLGGLKDVNGNYYSSPVCNADLNGGGCVCENVAGYNYYTCLPDVNGCTMCNASPQLTELDTIPAVYPGHIASMYYCLNQDHNYNTFTNEIRVVGAYESSNGNTGAHAPGAATINLRTCSGVTDLTKPIKLLLASYEPINWIIKSDDAYVINNINVDDIQVWSYYYSTSTVNIDSSLSSVINVTPQIIYASSSTLGFGYGSDSGGGSTGKLLKHIPTELGDYAYSFIGQYTIDTVQVCVGNQGQVNTFDIFQENDTPTTTNAATTTDSETTTDSGITTSDSATTTNSATTTSLSGTPETCTIWGQDPLIFDVIENVCEWCFKNRGRKKVCYEFVEIVGSAVDNDHSTGSLFNFDAWALEQVQCFLDYCSLDCDVDQLGIKDNKKLKDCGCDAFQCKCECETGKDSLCTGNKNRCKVNDNGCNQCVECIDQNDCPGATCNSNNECDNGNNPNGVNQVDVMVVILFVIGVFGSL